MKTQIKVSLDENVIKILEREADALGIRLQAYIQIVLGKHTIEVKKP
jgi:hypothetical protein